MKSIQFYQLNCGNSSSLELVNIGHKPEGNHRASSFLSAVSEALRTGNLSSTDSLEQLDNAVSDIQARVAAKKFFTFMSWIPFTEANFVSRSINQVKNQIESNKQALIEMQIANMRKLFASAAKNISDCDAFFIASQRLIHLIQTSYSQSKNSPVCQTVAMYKQLKENQFVLYYGDAEIGGGGVGHSPTSFSDSRGSHIVPFIVEFYPRYKLVKILDPDPDSLNPENQYYETMQQGRYSKVTKQKLFDKLINK